MCPHQSVEKITCDFRWRSNSPRSAYKIARCVAGFIRRSPRSAKIARCARCSDCDFRRSRRLAYKIADIWHVRYRRINSPAFAKCARSSDFLRSLLRIAIKANPSDWAILSHEFSKLPHRRDRRKKSPSVSASIGGDQIRRDRRIKSPGVSPA